VNQAYLFDRQSGDLLLVSHAAGAPATLGNGGTLAAGLSADGRFVLLQSGATNLVAGLADGFSADVFVYDRVAGAAELISRSAADPLTTTGGIGRGLTPDGRFVLLDSQNVRLAAGATDINGISFDVFVFDRQTGSAELISRSAAAPAISGSSGSTGGAISADGRFVYYHSHSVNLVAPFTDGNGSFRDLYLFDRQGGTATLVSHAAGNPSQGGNGSAEVRSTPKTISPDGRFLLYGSGATNLEAGVTDGNAAEDLYRYDRQSNSSTLVSRFGAGLVAGSAELDASLIGSTGEAVVASLQPLDPAAADPRPYFDLFAFAAGAVELLTATPLGGTAALGSVQTGDLTPDGLFLAWGGYLWDRQTETNDLVAHAAGSPNLPAAAEASAVTPDGRFVALYGTAADLAAGVTDANGRTDVYLYDRNPDTATLISQRAGVPSQAGSFDTGPSWLSADADKLALSSKSDDLVAGQSGPNNYFNLFFYDRNLGNAELISHHHASLTQTTDWGSILFDASPDGRYLLFESGAEDLIPGFVDHNNYFDDKFGIVHIRDLYFYDRVTDQATLVSHLPGLPTEGAPTAPSQARLAAGNAAIFYTSWTFTATAISDPKIYLWDRASNSNHLMLAGAALAPCNDHGILADLTADGRWLLFTSKCAFVPGDTNDAEDAYLLDRQLAQVQLISHQPGNPAVAAGGTADDLSADALKVVYSSPPFQLFSTDGALYSYDRLTQQATRLTSAYFDRSLPAPAALVEASEEGNVILATSTVTGLAPYDANTSADLFVIVLTGQMFADGFESGNTAAWSLTVP
jgi:Tol biopolymer transport system component